MQFTTSAILAATAAAVLVAAQQTHPYDGYIAEVCSPLNSSGLPDMNAPCNQMQALELQCIFGPEVGLAAFNAVNNPNLTNPLSADPEPAEQSKRVQQVCVCESQLWSALLGCAACERAHGSGDLVAFVDADFVASVSDAYCVASATPSLGFARFIQTATSLPASAASQYSAAQTSSFSDHVGNFTAVSYYYTPSVTGTAAWLVAEQTGTAGPSGPGNFTSVASSSGQIVPTASANAAAQTTASTSSSAGAGARETAAAMGVVGLLGLAALL